MSTVETAANTPIEPLDDRGSAVRFESQCVVIPDLGHHSRRPRVVTKSYALPLWKKRASSACSALPPEDPSGAEESRSHLVLRVPLPTFSLKSHSTARSVDHTPLPPCLVHRVQPAEPVCAGFPASHQHTRTPRKPSLSPSRSNIITVPLRPCCTACQSVTEAAAISGEAWPEHFSRGASRRRSVSADGGPRTLTVTGSAASASYAALGVSIHVDEVDKRRRSSDTGPSTSRKESPSGRAGEVKCASSTDPRVPPSPTCATPATPRIPEEEDEDELFPLPSPKRTPTTSPAGSLSSLMVAQISPTPSSCSGDSGSLHPNKRRFLEPPRSSSSSSLSLPKLSESTTDLTYVEDPPRMPSPQLLSAHPSLSGRPTSRSPRISCVPPSPTDPFTALDSTPPRISALPEPATSIMMPSSPTASHPPASPHHSPVHMRLPWGSKRSVSADFIPLVPSSSPTVPARVPSTSPHLPRSKKSFSISSPRHIITDVLRGVGAMGSAGVGVGAAL